MRIATLLPLLFAVGILFLVLAVPMAKTDDAEDDARAAELAFQLDVRAVRKERLHRRHGRIVNAILSLRARGQMPRSLTRLGIESVSLEGSDYIPEDECFVLITRDARFRDLVLKTRLPR